MYRHLQAARLYGLGDWRAVARQWVRWAQDWRAAELRRALRQALDADRALKSPRISDEAHIVSTLVLSWAAAAREAA